MDTNQPQGLLQLWPLCPWCAAVPSSDLRQPRVHYRFKHCTCIYLIITDWTIGSLAEESLLCHLRLSIKTISLCPPRWISKSPVLKSPYLIIPVCLSGLGSISPLRCSVLSLKKVFMPQVRPQILLCVLTKNWGPRGRVLFDLPTHTQ